VRVGVMRPMEFLAVLCSRAICSLSAPTSVPDTFQAAGATRTRGFLDRSWSNLLPTIRRGRHVSPRRPRVAGAPVAMRCFELITSAPRPRGETHHRCADDSQHVGSSGRRGEWARAALHPRV